MKNCIIIFFSLFSLIGYSQSLSGTLKAKKTESELSYGNVDIYQNDVLVKSVYTDAEGNFNVALDTGMYTCVINYAGHLPVTKKVQVNKDERSVFEMDEDPSKPRPIAVVTSEAPSEFGSGVELSEVAVTSGISVRGSRGSGRRMSLEKSSTSGWSYADSGSKSERKDDKGLKDYNREKGRSGALTAGEINDFSKWKMWQDLSESELKNYVKSWGIAPQGRYTLELKSQSGLPLADASVKLVSKSQGEIYAAHTDNTGRAELWLTIADGSISRSELSMSIDYQGQKAKIRKVKPFTESVNHYTMEVDCQENYNVDIAFVVDATGSMGDELSYLKAEMNDVMFKAKKINDRLNFHFANVFYRDKGDAYVTKSMDFSRILSESVQFVNHQHAGGGGDYEEAVEIALDSAINNLSWNEQARSRIVFLILDAPPHNTPENRKKMAQLTKQAAEKGIRIVPVGASGINKATEYLLRTMAIGTNGTYTFLTDHSGIGNGHIEPSTDSYKVETFNDLMVRIIKSYTYMPDCEQNIPDLNLEFPDSLISIAQDLDSLAITSDTAGVRDSLDVIPDQLPQVSWSYYPNPTTGIINVKADTDIEELFLTDLSGKLLTSIKDLSSGRVYQMDLTEYTTGVYLIRYLHKDRWISGKIMLQR